MKPPLIFLLIFIFVLGCKKNIDNPSKIEIPDLIESLTVKIWNLNPEKFDTINGLLNDSMFFSIPHILTDSNFIAQYPIVYLNGLFASDNTLFINNPNPAPDHFTPPNAFRLYLGFPDTSYFNSNSKYIDQSGISFWRNYAIDGACLSKGINLNPSFGANTNSVFNSSDTINITEKKYENGILLITGSFSGKTYWQITSKWGLTILTSSESWYFKGSFTNLRWHTSTL